MFPVRKPEEADRRDERDERDEQFQRVLRQFELLHYSQRMAWT
ncbi:hypothetical protein [Paenibacillus larvae]|nr:hypothetical protein [Paenibacillus larvae]